MFTESRQLPRVSRRFDDYVDRSLFERELLCLLPRVLKRLRASAPELSLKKPNIRHDKECEKCKSFTAQMFYSRLDTTDLINHLRIWDNGFYQLITRCDSAF